MTKQEADILMKILNQEIGEISKDIDSLAKENQKLFVAVESLLKACGGLKYASEKVDLKSLPVEFAPILVGIMTTSAVYEEVLDALIDNAPRPSLRLKN